MLNSCFCQRVPKIKPETKVLIIKNLKSKSPAELCGGAREICKVDRNIDSAKYQQCSDAS